MSELIYSSERGGETVFYNISNRFDIFLRLRLFEVKEDKFSVVGCLNRFRGLSETILLGNEGLNVLSQIFDIAEQFKDRESTACCIF